MTVAKKTILTRKNSRISQNENQDEKIISLLREIDTINNLKKQAEQSKNDTEIASLDDEVNKLSQATQKLVISELKKDFPGLKITRKPEENHQKLIALKLEYYKNIMLNEKYEELDAENKTLIQEKVRTEISQSANKAVRRIRNKERAAYLERINLLETIIYAEDKLSNMEFRPPSWVNKKDRGLNDEEIDILLLSDLHFGEKVDPTEVDNLNAYNINIAKERYRRAISRTIAEANKSKVEKHGIVLLRGGDFISGEIHEELQQTNDLNSLESVLTLAQEEYYGIKQLEEHYGKVWVISVPGNHGRITKKPQAKKYSANNYDTQLARFLADKFKGNENITFYTPESGDAYFSLLGYNFLLTHGDRIGSRGGTGFIGPGANILKGAKKLRDSYGSVGKHLKTIFIGHFHSFSHNEGIISNSSLVGYSEYAKTLRCDPSLASQTLCTVGKYGVRKVEQIIVQETEKDIKLYYKQPSMENNSNGKNNLDWTKLRSKPVQHQITNEQINKILERQNG